MPKQYYSWSDIPEETIQEFRAAIDKLKDDLPIDCDRDPPFQVVVIDRRKYEPWHWNRVPYYHKDPEGHFREVFDNLQLATGSMDTAMRLRRIDNTHTTSVNTDLLEALEEIAKEPDWWNQKDHPPADVLKEALDAHTAIARDAIAKARDVKP